MPLLGRVDPVDLETKARADAGLCRVEKVVRCRTPHPCCGGSSGYDEWYRDEQLERWHNGELVDASRASLYQWEQRRERYRCTVNGDRRTLVGVDLINPVTFLLAHPDATINEMSTFIYNKGGGLYDRRRVQQRLSKPKITKEEGINGDIPGPHTHQLTLRVSILELWSTSWSQGCPTTTPH